MPPIILPRAFLYAPNTFKPVSHIGAINNTSSTVLNLKKKRGLLHAFRSQNSSFISKSFFYHHISVNFPKTQAFYLYAFLPLYFRTLSQNLSFIFIRLYQYISVHCPNPQALCLLSFLTLYFRTLS